MIPIVITQFTADAISMFALLRTGDATRNSNGTWAVSVSVEGATIGGTFPSRPSALDWMCAQITA
jgi:hypothetical protein